MRVLTNLASVNRLALFHEMVAAKTIHIGCVISELTSSYHEASLKTLNKRTDFFCGLHKMHWLALE